MVSPLAPLTPSIFSLSTTMSSPLGIKSLKASDTQAERRERTVAEGARYKGQWKGEHMHGHGRLTKSDGQIYEGHFENSRAHGHGLWQEGTGTSYEGQWY